MAEQIQIPEPKLHQLDIISPDPELVVPYLVQTMDRTLPVFVIDMVNARKDARWNHEQHQAVLVEAARLAGHVLVSKDLVGFVPENDKHQAPMHTDQSGLAPDQTKVRLHTSDVAADGMFVNPVIPGDQSYYDSSFKNMSDSIADLYNPRRMESQFRGGRIQAKQSSVFRRADTFRTIHRFMTPQPPQGQIRPLRSYYASDYVLDRQRSTK